MAYRALSRLAFLLLTSLAMGWIGCTEADQLRRLAQQNDPQAAFKLGSMYLRGHGVRQNVEEALRWYRRAAEEEHAEAQMKLAMMYATGQGVPQSYLIASRYYRQAAHQGHGEAQVELGLLYSQGKGVPQDYAQALQLFRHAAEHGYARAQLKIAEMYAEGRGVPRDLVQAHMWANLSGSQGDKQAVILRDTLAIKMTTDQLAKAQRLARERRNQN